MAAAGATVHRKFLLTEGGPTYRLQVRLGLIRAGSHRTVRKALLSILITWGLLLILSTMQGNAIGNHVAIPFLRDFAVHSRFLFAVPILIVAKLILGPRLTHAASHFVESGLVLEQDFAKFDAAVEDGLRWRDSVLPESVLLLLAFGAAIIGQMSFAPNVSTWHALKADSGISLTWAGWWLALFCVPLFQFLALRWIWRLFLWAQFLWRMNRLKLKLVPTHPDEAGGLAFVGEAQSFFGMVLLGYSIAAAGVIANRVVYEKIPLPHFAPAMGVYTFISVAIVLIPLFLFAVTLRKTKRIGLHQYGALALEYTSSFHHKWVIGRRQTEETLLGSGDIQSLADLGNSYGLVEKMNSVPMGPRTPIKLALACLVPMSPLLLTMMPLKEILKMVVKVIL
jgi:hypothetical protein